MLLRISAQSQRPILPVLSPPMTFGNQDEAGRETFVYFLHVNFDSYDYILRSEHF